MTLTAAPTATSTGRLARWLPLGGLAYAVLQIAGDLTIDKFPDGNTSPADLTAWYAAHHAHVVAGGELMALSAVGMALFAAGLVHRVRRSMGAAAVVAIGGIMAAMDAATDGSTYSLLGGVSTEKRLDPVALQALHQLGAEGGVTTSVLVLTLGLALAAFGGRSFPTWLAVTGLALGIAAYTPVGFLASLLFLLWCAVAGVVIATSRRQH